MQDRLLPEDLGEALQKLGRALALLKKADASGDDVRTAAELVLQATPLVTSRARQCVQESKEYENFNDRLSRLEKNVQALGSAGEPPPDGGLMLATAIFRIAILTIGGFFGGGIAGALVGDELVDEALKGATAAFITQSVAEIAESAVTHVSQSRHGGAYVVPSSRREPAAPSKRSTVSMAGTGGKILKSDELDSPSTGRDR